MTVGSDAVLPCVASGYPVPDIKWSKVTEIYFNKLFVDADFIHDTDLVSVCFCVQLEGELAPKCVQDVNVLTVPRVTHDDSGTYVCTASNKQGKVEAFTTLQVHG